MMIPVRYTRYIKTNVVAFSTEIHLKNGRFPKNSEKTGPQKEDQSIEDKLRVFIGQIEPGNQIIVHQIVNSHIENGVQNNTYHQLI